MSRAPWEHEDAVYGPCSSQEIVPPPAPRSLSTRKRSKSHKRRTERDVMTASRLRKGAGPEVQFHQSAAEAEAPGALFTATSAKSSAHNATECRKRVAWRETVTKCGKTGGKYKRQQTETWCIGVSVFVSCFSVFAFLPNSLPPCSSVVFSVEPLEAVASIVEESSAGKNNNPRGLQAEGY